MNITNRNRIYRLVYDADEISKPEIAQKLGISLPTAIQNVKALQEDGLLLEGEPLESTNGRKAVAIICAQNARFALGVDITRNHINIVLVNMRVEIMAGKRINIGFENTAAYFQTLRNAVLELVEESGCAADSIIGIGLSVPGVLSQDAQMLIYSHVLEVSGLSCRTICGNLPWRSVFCNDANAAGIAEMGIGKRRQNMIYLSLSNSVGGAIILDGQLVAGESQRAGEFGHMTLVKGGLPCYCGRHGCVDAYCAVNTLSRHTEGNLQLFFERLEGGNDQSLHALWDQYLHWLAATVNTLLTAFDCRIILGGYLGEYLDRYLEILRGMVAEISTFAGAENYISVCRLKRDSAAVGAALLHIQRFIEQI